MRYASAIGSRQSANRDRATRARGGVALSLGRLLAVVGCVLAGPAVAAQAPADLPPAESVVRALDAHPKVQAAQARLTAAQAEGERLLAGEHEFGLSLLSQQRRVRAGPDYQEWSVGIERGLRLPGKAGLDRAIGAKGVAEAAERLGDARHETARQLLELWYGRLLARAEVALWRQQVDVLQEQRRTTEIRVRRGDAARLDSLQAEAALAQAESELRRAEAREQIALAELVAHFPELPPAGTASAEPVLPAEGEAHWAQRLLAHNHEILAVQRAQERLRLQAERAGAERLPDPRLGLHYARELDGRENIVGVSLSIDLPGAARQARAELYRAEAEAMAQDVAQVRRRLLAEAAGNWQRASAGVEGYQRLKAAAEAVERHAELSRRAYRLGELGLGETLLAQRAALQARLAAEQGRLEANLAIARLLLDAHSLWLAEPDEAEHR
ncbi:outer membrane protein TolC [Sulfuritortus calidifontis]|uniref:Outer membrane protein TolC n=1 Tax=Sulfuritortus calidifontis TaxID=1914471 RepID=A0A4R3JUX0_9PROT|nr:TolC family protein [Sulfuritortus calidifontis]TCS70017.1 outer membrane protein TolC [Sulfuritortus calidifontis]